MLELLLVPLVLLLVFDRFGLLVGRILPAFGLFCLVDLAAVLAMLSAAYMQLLLLLVASMLSFTILIAIVVLPQSFL